MANQKPLFVFTSRLDNRQYAAVWDRDRAVIRVDLPSTGAAWSGNAPPPMAPATSSVFGDSIDIDIVRAFEEGRLSHKDHDCPYTSAKTANNATAWAFGTFFR